MIIWKLLLGACPFLLPFSPSPFYAILIWYVGARLSSKITLNECGLSIRSPVSKAAIRWEAIDVIVDHNMFGMSLQCGNSWVYIPPIMIGYSLLREDIKRLSPNAKILSSTAALALKANSATNSSCRQNLKRISNQPE
jgi:hypothetical protein